MRHRLHPGQQLRDRRSQHDAQLVAGFAQPALHRHAPGAEEVVRVQDLLAVEEDLGEGVEAFEHEVVARVVEHLARRRERRAVFPVGQADPLQARFGRADVGIRDQAMRQQVGVDGAGDARQAPGRGFRMRSRLRVAGDQAEFPAIGKRLHVRGTGRKRTDGKERETDAGQPSPWQALVVGESWHWRHAVCVQVAGALQCRSMKSWCEGIAATAFATVCRTCSTNCTNRSSGTWSTIGW